VIVSVLGVFLFFGPPALSFVDSPGLEGLETTIKEYYTAIQKNQWEQAEKYVWKKSLRKFREEGRGKVLGYRIVEINPEEGMKSAVAEVAVKAIIKPVAVPVEIPTFTRWKLQSKKWFIDPADPPPSRADKFQACYYDRLNRKIPDEVKFDKKIVDFGDVEQGQPLTLKFPFKNTSSPEVTVARVYVQEPFMRDQSPKASTKPGEGGEVVIELDTSSFHLLYDQTVFVEFQPINECNRLRMTGRILKAEELKRRSEKAKGTKAPKPAETPQEGKPKSN
jgi:hypothetical protein